MRLRIRAVKLAQSFVGLEDAELGAFEHRRRARVGEAEGALRARGARRPARRRCRSRTFALTVPLQRQPARVRSCSSAGSACAPVRISTRPPRAPVTLPSRSAITPVDEDQPDAFGQSRRLVVRRAIDHRGGIEHREVRRHAGRDEAAIDHADRVRRQRGHLPHRVLPRQRLACRGRSGRARAETTRTRADAGACRSTRRSRRRSTSSGAAGSCTRSASAPNRRIAVDVALLEDADDGFARRRLLLAHEVDELLLRRRQEDAFGAAEPRLHRLLGLRDDPRALRRDPRSASASRRGRRPAPRPG